MDEVKIILQCSYTTQYKTLGWQGTEESYNSDKSVNEYVSDFIVQT